MEHRESRLGKFSLFGFRIRMVLRDDNGDLCVLCLGLAKNGRAAGWWSVIQGTSGHPYQVINSLLYADWMLLFAFIIQLAADCSEEC